MIHKMKQSELEQIIEIWLQGNLLAHDFIKKEYWLDNLGLVKEQFKQADIFVYSDNNLIKGFAGLKDNYIAGIFVLKEYQNQGIGSRIMGYLKENYSQLSLNVYEKNYSACKFYMKNDFVKLLEDIDPDTNEKEYQFFWRK